MTHFLLQTIVLVSAVIIIARTEPALNYMDKHTPLLVRLSFYMLAFGATAEIVVVVSGDDMSWQSAIITVGIASLLFCERRLRILFPPNKRRAS